MDEVKLIQTIVVQTEHLLSRNYSYSQALWNFRKDHFHMATLPLPSKEISTNAPSASGESALAACGCVWAGENVAV